MNLFNKLNLLKLRLPNREKHGLVDGGHTYEVIKANIENLPYDQYVTIEIMTGIEDDFTEIAGARNTSVQVKDKSLAELEGKLDVIHLLMKGLPFEQDINYVEFDDKDIDVLEVVALLTIFHNDLHKNAHPMYCYSGKATALKVYLRQRETYSKLRDVAADIFQLHFRCA
ncbi:MAG: AIPR family protein [Nitrospirae bacterium]|nr:AIPR family protein [Nitrospirota bacterium]